LEGGYSNFRKVPEMNKFLAALIAAAFATTGAFAADAPAKKEEAAKPAAAASAAKKVEKAAEAKPAASAAKK
jgi:nucleoid-associated protein YgaU